MKIVTDSFVSVKENSLSPPPASEAAGANPPQLIGGFQLSGKSDFFAQALHFRQSTEKSALAADYEQKKSDALQKWLTTSCSRAEQNQAKRSADLEKVLNKKFPSFDSPGGAPFGKVSPAIGSSCPIDDPLLKPALFGFDYFAATGYVCTSFVEQEIPGLFIDGKPVTKEVGVPNLDATLVYLRDVVKSYWPKCFDHIDNFSHAPIGYKFAESWFGGCIKIAWNPDRPDQRCYFMCTGSLMEQLDYFNQYDLILSMVGHFGFKPTRVDPYLRDFDYKISPKEIAGWHDAGFLCRFRSDSAGWQTKGAKGKKGQTWKAGNRGKSGGGIYLRVYDETVEPRSPVPCIKYECEYSSHKAQNLIQRFLSQPFSEDAFYQFCQESVIGPGVIDFRSGEKNKKLDSRKRVHKWHKFVEGIKSVKIAGKPKKPKLPGFPLVAFSHQWGKKLAEVALRDPSYLIENLKILSGDLSPIIHHALLSGERRLQVLKKENTG